jgi:DUF4097 and DUF4098 domain-containing protein YvlB
LEGANAETLTVESDSGDIDVSALVVSEQIKIGNSFGKIDINQARTGSLLIDSDSGAIYASGISTGQLLQIDSSFGDVYVGGYLGGRSTIDADSGDTQLALTNDRNEISVDLQADSGNIKVNGDGAGNSFSAAAKQGYSDKLTVDVSFGSIELNFK